MPQATRDRQLFYQYHCKQRPALNWPESTENSNHTTSSKILVRNQCPKYGGKSYLQKFFSQSHFRLQGPRLNQPEPMENIYYVNWFWNALRKWHLTLEEYHVTRNTFAKSFQETTTHSLPSIKADHYAFWGAFKKSNSLLNASKYLRHKEIQF